MNNITSNFSQIVAFAEQQGMPKEKKRGILREYLQSQFLSFFYAQPKSSKLSFVGGTSLRLLRNLNRFSEDLDFDNLGLTDVEVQKLVESVTQSFQRENIEVELVSTLREYETYFSLKFPQLLFDLKISTNDKEKVMIKVDYSARWKSQKPEIVLFSKYGFVEQVTTNPLNQLMVQKLTTYVQRKETQPRDIFDVVWLYSQGARIDQDFAEANNLGNLVQKAEEKVTKEGVTENMKAKLAPFLFDQGELRKLELFPAVLKKL
jgi:predicted nucleotidyltransferase component of viral defense system